MLAIKLSKVGKTNKKVFRLIISEKSRDPFGKVLEILGSYNPHSKEFQAKADRIKYWLSQGAQMTPTVNNLLISQKIITGEKVKASKVGSPKKGKKTEKKTASPEEIKTEKEEKPIKNDDPIKETSEKGAEASSSPAEKKE